MAKYHFTGDPGHGWLHVKRAELVRLGILEKITSYSYQRGDTVYLEEDCDFSTFVDAKRARGEPVEYVRKDVDRTPIRGYACFKVLEAERAKAFVDEHLIVVHVKD